MSQPKTEPVVDCSNDIVLTKQSFKKEADINHIMARYVKTGLMSPEALNLRQNNFADVAQIGDFQSCQEQLLEAEKAFMTLAVDVRTRFNNNPAELLDFLTIEENREEAQELGIIPTPEPEQVTTEEPTETPPETPPETTDAPKPAA